MNRKFYNNALKRHLNNIGGTSYYEYIFNREDAENSWYRAHADLGYPLRKESARDRYLIYNKEGLEKQVEKIIMDEIVNNLQELSQMVIQDINQGVVDSLNSITAVGDKWVSKSAATPKTDYAAKLGKALGTAVGKGISNLVEDILDDE